MYYDIGQTAAEYSPISRRRWAWKTRSPWNHDDADEDDIHQNDNYV